MMKQGMDLEIIPFANALESKVSLCTREENSFSDVTTISVHIPVGAVGFLVALRVGTRKEWRASFQEVPEISRISAYLS